MHRHGESAATEKQLRRWEQDRYLILENCSRTGAAYPHTYYDPDSTEQLRLMLEDGTDL